MTANADAMRTEVANWHTQALTKLPGKKSFVSTFKKPANDAKKSVDDVIPGFEFALKAAKKNLASFNPGNNPDVLSLAKQQELTMLQNNVQTAEAAYNMASKYAPDVQKFKGKMDQLIRDVDLEIATLMQDHDNISDNIQAFADAEKQGQFQVQSQLSSRVETPGSDSGESLILYFIESMPDEKRR